MRDLEGFTQTQHLILELKPNLKVNWLAFALGKHVKGDLKGAVDIIDIFLSTLEEGSTDLQKNYETSELALYKNSIIAESGRWNEALDHLIECQKKDIIVDYFSWLKMCGFYQLQLDSFDEAKTTFNKLFERGSTDDYSVHTGYMLAILKIGGDLSKRMMKAKGARALPSLLVLTDAQKTTLKDEYKNQLLVQYPKSAAIMRIIMMLLDIESKEWTDKIQSYIQTNLKRGVPSLGDDLSALFLCCCPDNGNEYYIAQDPVDVKSHKAFRSISNIVDGIIDSLEGNSTFPNDDEIQPPSTLLWAWFLRSTLYEFAAEYREAVHFIDKCIDQTPTGVDLYELKGRLLKKAGDIHAAAECLDKGRELDKQDRYINNMTTKYLLQGDREEEALEKMALFTRHESDPEQNIFDMQVTWYELELAACYGRKKMFGKCLRSYVSVEKHFEDIHEDQFDFHAYCIRKVTLRAYVDVLRWEDSIWGQDTYVRAAEGIIKTYLHLHDEPTKNSEDNEIDYSSMTAAERKRAKAIARKIKLKNEKKVLEEAKRRDADDAKTKSESKKSVKDEDPDGLELLNKCHLDEAKKYAGTLVKNAPNHLNTWLCQYDVSIRRDKALMALRALFQASHLSNQSKVMHHELFKRIIDFHENVKLAEGSHPAVVEVFNFEKAALLGSSSKSLHEFVLEWYEHAKANPLTALGLRVEISKAMLRYKVRSPMDASNLIIENGLNVRDATLNNCVEALKVLKSIEESDDRVTEFAALARNMYYLSSNL
mmetsp:Transcript_1751/g.3171  ORF Transcript_1751/g.3171 Transcript_1751/m.3171 type:complete len:765 (+) Transcript_1751:704-2998(+)